MIDGIYISLLALLIFKDVSLERNNVFLWNDLIKVMVYGLHKFHFVLHNIGN